MKRAFVLLVSLFELGNIELKEGKRGKKKRKKKKKLFDSVTVWNLMKATIACATLILERRV